MKDEGGEGSGQAVKIVAGILFFILLAASFTYLLKIANGESCGREEYTYYGGGALQLGATIATANGYVLQHVPKEVYNYEFEEYYFCFGANATEGTEIEIITLGRTIAKAAIGMGYEYSCYHIPISDNDTLNYIGIKCPTCSAANPKIYLYEEVLGVDVERVTKTTSLTVEEDNTLNFSVLTYHKCWNSIKYFLLWFITGLLLLSLVLLVTFGFKKIKKVLDF